MVGIQVEYIDHMGDDLRVANVARVSFNKWKEEFDQKDARLIDYLAIHEHTSPFRHTALTVRCKAPIFLARQLGKHQVGLSWNEVSRRYVDSDVEFYIPDSWRSRPSGGIKQGSGGVHPRSEDYSVDYNMFLKVCTDMYEGMLNTGVAPEMARMVLPQSMMVDWVWTGNLLAFFHVWRLRTGAGAQVEASEFAKQLNDITQPLFPHSWEALKNE